MQLCNGLLLVVIWARKRLPFGAAWWQRSLMLSARIVSSAELPADTDLRLFLRSKSKGMSGLLRLSSGYCSAYILDSVSWKLVVLGFVEFCKSHKISPSRTFLSFFFGNLILQLCFPLVLKMATGTSHRTSHRTSPVDDFRITGAIGVVSMRSLLNNITPKLRFRRCKFDCRLTFL